MRILVDCAKVRTGGSIQVALGMLHNMAQDRTHEWHVVTSTEVNKEVAEALRTQFASYRELPSGHNVMTRIFRPRRELPRLEAEIGPDLVYSIFGPTFWRSRHRRVTGFGYGLAINPDSPVMKMPPLLSRIKGGFWNWLTRRDYRTPDFIIGETETVRQRIHKYIHVPLDRILVVRNSYSPAFEAALKNSPRNLPTDKLRILCMSSYYLHKNLELLARVAPLLAKRLDRPFEILFTVPETNPGWQKIRAIAEHGGAGACLRTIGHVPNKDIAPLYRSSHLVCLPTLLESSTATYPESFMAGVPLATSNLDFARELCGEGAAYFDPYSPEDTARVLAEILTDEALQQNMVERGTAALKKNYPSPAEKWQATLDALQYAGSHGGR